MRPGFFYYRRWLNRRTLLRSLVFALVVMVISSLILTTAHLRPVLESLAATRVSFVVNSIISRSVQEAIDSGEISYEKLVSFEKDYEGRITAVHSNMVACKSQRLCAAGWARAGDLCADGVGRELLGLV